MIIYAHPIKIYYKDVDQMGIVYYLRYYKYFEEARTELLGSIGLDVMDVEKTVITFPVISSHCEYIRGAKFERSILVKASMDSKPMSKLNIDYFVFIENEKDFIVSGYTEHAFVNKRGQAVRAPKIILDHLGKIDKKSENFRIFFCPIWPNKNGSGGLRIGSYMRKNSLGKKSSTNFRECSRFFSENGLKLILEAF